MKYKKEPVFMKIAIVAFVVLSFQWIALSDIWASSNTVYCKSEERTIQELNKLETATKTIVLDAGHGGYDAGSSVNGYLEKNIALDIVEKLGYKLEIEGFQVVYTRTSDKRDYKLIREDLEQRTRISEMANADLFISIHLNEYHDDTKGIETWVSYSDSESFAFAEIVQDKLVRLKYSLDRGLKNQDDSPLYVLYNNHSPSVLIELGFMSSQEDMSYLTDESMQEDIATTITAAIIEYW